MPPSLFPTKKAIPGRAAITLHAAFVLAGIATTMLGPLMPGMQARWNIADDRAGLLFTAQFLASVGAAAGVGKLARRFGYSALIRVGLLLVAAGVAGCAGSSWPAALACVAVYGCGLGLVIPAGNLGVAALHPGAESRHVMALNLSWCAGAVAAPILVASLAGSFLWMLAAAVVVFAGLWDSGGRPERSGIARSAVPASKLPLLLTALLLFLYVGAESAIGGWVAMLTLRSGNGQNLWAILPSAFWAGMLAGRLLAPPLLAMFRPSAIVIAGLTIALASAAILIAGRSDWSVAAGALSGFGLSPVFPLVVAQYAQAAVGGSASGLIFSAAGLGGAAVPAMVGLVSHRYGNLRVGMSAVLFCVAAMLVLQWRLTQAFRKIPDCGISA